VFRFASRGWTVSRIVGPLASDGLYGLGGVSFKAPPGVRARFGTDDQGRFGRKVSRFVFSYLEQPAGGSFEVNVDGAHHATLDASGTEKRVKSYELKVEDGAHLFEIVTKSGMPRAFGVVLERHEPGVVLDALGVQGARIRFLDKMDDAHFAEQLRWRSPDLVIFQFGANESGDGFAYPMPEYYATMRRVLEQTRAALPDSGCLVLAAMDRARREDGVLTSMAIIPLIVKEQQRAAHDVGCAFFDTYRAMGGHGSMPTWVRRGLGQADFTHPSGVGSEVLGKWIYRALMQGYNAYLGRQATPARR
jgi:lysophospholipase L1-like esterase